MTWALGNWSYHRQAQTESPAPGIQLLCANVHDLPQATHSLSVLLHSCSHSAALHPWTLGPELAWATKMANVRTICVQHNTSQKLAHFCQLLAHLK